MTLTLPHVGAGPLTRRACTVDAFVHMAASRVALSEAACWLDHAGPGDGPSFLSGEVWAVILETDTGALWLDRDAAQPVSLGHGDVAGFIAAFSHQGKGEAGGPMIFPLLTYESFAQGPIAPRPHPIWPSVRAAWLVCSNHYRFEDGVLVGPDVTPPTFSLSLVANQNEAFGWRESEAAYGQKIEQVRRHITDGIYYQANLSQRFHTRSAQDPVDVYLDLRRRNPSPFMGVFRLGDLWVLSGSPERLVDKRGRRISARPIAGTRPRHQDPQADMRSRKELTASEKERAEHVMLVDLIRNDLGRVAATGSVRVTEFETVESYSHVHHLVSNVDAELAAEQGVWSLIASMFPGGTITGAPKISCMKALANLEGERRGPYTGSMGYLTDAGDLDLNILIRTLIYADGRWCLHAGGGIVADSMESAEYMETRYKSAALLEALGLA